ncbi:hypothetical protein [Aeromicrobium wangtongii]|uniref:PH domain-containing protein n=1 Tax=Aeromicrobium wangtongii TaxID=2969247 RepID=A0ABY5M8V8_9ACTN|nr:hypothetical protein [Aeromicrobium wangtongii]MCD9200124.1 hypothetical protein [Aeromicrobium wangtongii]UUP13379.1 hypothetical protein NQV15_16250 [Aeromicrobium wangtongii]
MPLELSFAPQVRVARWIGLGSLGLGVLFVYLTLTGYASGSGSGTTGLVVGLVVAAIFGGFGAVVLWTLRGASAAGLRIDGTGITSTTGRGTVLVTWGELAAVDVWCWVRVVSRGGAKLPKSMRTKVSILVRLAPLDEEDFGSRPDLRPLARIDQTPFTRAIGVPGPTLGRGDKLPTVDQIATALAAFGGDRFRGVVRT